MTDTCDYVKQLKRKASDRTSNTIIAESFQKKGTLIMNNGHPFGRSWKKPKLEFALQSKQGINGGETEQRFYMKFPCYRPRNRAPSVKDDIKRVLLETTTPVKFDYC